jgi:hypothetical protein
MFCFGTISTDSPLQDHVIAADQAASAKSKMVQLHLDVGQKDALMAVCKVCNMHYSRGVASDEAAHRKFHDTFVNGVDWTAADDLPGSGNLSEPCDCLDRRLLDNAECR